MGWFGIRIRIDRDQASGSGRFSSCHGADMEPQTADWEARVRERFSLGEGFLAAGRVLRAGRTLTVCQADVFTTGASDRMLIATILSTIMVRGPAAAGPRR